MSATKTCPRCAEEVQEAASVCKHCGYRLKGRYAGAAAAGLLLVFAVSFCGSPGSDKAKTSPAAVPKLAAAQIAECSALLEKGKEAGLIKARPSANRINVEDALWRSMPADSKNGMLAALACDAFNATTLSTEQHVVAYGHRSGRRLAMLTSVGVNHE